MVFAINNAGTCAELGGKKTHLLSLCGDTNTAGF